MKLSTKAIFLQRLLSMVMSLAIIASMVFIVSVPVSAATVDISTFNAKLTEFQNTKYANNSVYVDNPGLTGGYECFGFANELALFIFGSYPTHVGNGTQARAGWTVTYGSSAVDNLSAGDIVRRRSNGSNSTSDHSIFITGINGDTIYYCDANSDYRNTVKYNQSTTKSALKTAISRNLYGDSSKTGWVAHHKDNNTSGGTTSIIFDLNTFNLRFSEFQTNRYANGSTYVDNPDLTGGYCGFGFANELSVYMFGTYPTYHSSAPAHTVTEGWTITYGSSAIDNLTIADTVRFVHDNGEWDHTIFVTNIDKDNIYYCDANYDDKNTVRYNMSISKSELKTKVSKNLITGDSTGWVAHHENNMIQAPSSSCSCTTDYAGTYRYTVPNACIEIWSGHGTDYEILGFITADDLITVTKSNGEWAHVEFQGISGYASMAYLEKIDTTKLFTVTYTGGENVTGLAPTQDPVIYGTRITVAESGYIKPGYAFAGWSDGINTYYAGDTYTVNKDTVFTAVWHLPTLMRVLVSHNSQRFNGLATKDVALQFKGSDISETQSIIISFDKTKVAPITTVNGAEALGEECYLYEAWDATSKDYSGKLAYNSDGEEYFYDLADTVKSGLTVTDKWQSSGIVPVISYAEIGNTGCISIIVHQDKRVTYSDFTSAVTLRFAVLNGSFDDNSIKLATTAQANSLNSSTSALLSAYSGDELITYVYYDSGNNISTLSTPKIEVKGFAISGKVTYDNPKEPIGILLYEGDTLIDSVWPEVIDATGNITRDFSLSVDKAGTYTLKVTKADALDYTINNIIVTDTDVDLTESSSSNISLIRMISGDINEDGYIDSSDITCFVYDMGKSELDARYSHTDINGDNYRDALDVAILAAGIFSKAPSVEYTP